jgi:ribosomal protein S24E
VSKDELRSKLSELYKANKDQVTVFGFRTQYGGGKSTGFALIYDSHEALKKFEPHYRLVRIGAATKIEKPSRQQRTYNIVMAWKWNGMDLIILIYRQATQEPCQDTSGYCEGQGCGQEEGKEIDDGGMAALEAMFEFEYGENLGRSCLCTYIPIRYTCITVDTWIKALCHN